MRWLVPLGILAGVGLSAARAEVESGPAAGSKVEPLKVYAVVGPVTDKEVDYAAERKEKPTIYAFVQREFFDRPMARLLRTLDEAAPNTAEDLQVVIVFLGEDVDQMKKYLPRLQQSVNFQNSALTVFEGDKSGPNNWGINTDAHLTIAVAKKGKVVQSFAFETVNETDARKVLKTVK